ncbi:MAG TPA: hypothetical protein ENN84_10585 [Candidatus Marinimicrobia bacterium]|nr:hypothetical protein [Candidatus Neomarinimicrobiota bacterium]
MKSTWLQMLSIITGSLLMSAALYAESWQIGGTTYLEFSQDTEKNKRYMENWSTLLANYGAWEIGLRYEMHLPPQAYSPDTSGQGIYQRRAVYRSDRWQITTGNFYGSFGQGLILAAYENRDLRWDTNIDGFKIATQRTFVDLQLLAGRMRALSGKRLNPIYGSELTLHTLQFADIGAALLTMESRSAGEQTWSSAFSKIILPYGDLYGEYAIRNMATPLTNGKAFYINANFFLSKFSIRGEYKNYQQFELYDGVIYNNPPTAVKEHQYALLGRHQHIITPNNEEGYLAEISWLPAFGYLEFHYSAAQNSYGKQVWEEIYTHFDLFAPGEWNWTLIGDRQENLEARYLNAVLSASTPLFRKLSFKTAFEHQHATILLTERMYYDQAIMLSVSHSAGLSLAYLAEWSTDQFSEKKFWHALQVDYKLGTHIDMTFFAGSRREGKVCAGGVCVIKPEFTGAEMRLSGTF